MTLSPSDAHLRARRAPEYTVDGGAADPVHGAVHDLDEGNHIVHYWSTDNAGNSGVAEHR